MSLTSISQTIRNHFNANFSECPFVFENNKYETTNEIFCRLNILTNTPSQLGIGLNACYREFGIVSINIFEPKNDGTFDSERIADIIANVFKQQRIDGVKFELPTFTKLGLIKDFNQTNVSIDYSYTQTG